LHGPLFGGVKGGPLYEARLIGGGSQGDGGFDLTFWDPHHRDGWQRSVARVGKSDVVTLQCGDVATSLHMVSKAKAKALLQTSPLREPPWQRALVAAGRDDDLTWYLVDGVRDATTGAEDLALYVGRKGHIVAVDAEGARVGDDLVFAGEGVRLRLPPPGDHVGAWTLGGVTKDVRPVDIFAVAAEVYGVVHPWGETPLGTPCDPGPPSTSTTTKKAP